MPIHNNQEKKRKFLCLLGCLIILGSLLLLGACGGTADSGDPQYEAQKIAISGGPDGDKEISVAELRALPQHKLDASYKRTTGLFEEFKMEGPYVSEVFDSLGLVLTDYEAIGVQGSDGYYCLIPREVIEATPEMMLAVVVDGKAKLSEEEAPVRLGVQGQFGPYWVKKIDKITLFKEIPKKEITSVWVFDNLTKGIEPYQYEYYGSKDDAIELAQVFSRFDKVDGSAFFTMKSSDGFEKSEALNMVKSRYYIKVKGADAPTNISPYIKLGMNVKNIAWLSTNADAAIFPKKMEEYMDKTTIRGKSGLPLSEILYEAGVETVESATFDLLGTNGEKVSVSGKNLADIILCCESEGSYQVVFGDTIPNQTIGNLMRIRLSGQQEAESTTKTEETKAKANEATASKNQTSKTGNSNSGTKSKADSVLTIKGNGVGQTTTWSLADLQALSGQAGDSYSMVNNWPTRKFFAGQGVSIGSLLKAAGIKEGAATIKVIASDGYYATLTRGQLLNQQYYYPNVEQSSASGATKVPAILAWACNEDSGSIKGVKDCKLRLLVGQRGVNDVNTDVAVKNVSSIEVLTSGGGAWQAPEAFPSSGEVESGTEVSFRYDDMDKVKIYYTTDGSKPTLNSKVYNPSTSYFQPDLTKPIIINQSTTIKVLVAGWGKNDSTVASFSYQVK